MYKQIKIEKKELQALLQKDRNMGMLIDLVGNIERDYIPNPFIALVNSIVFQQLAYKAAITIWNRFEALVGEITPKILLSFSDEELRGCGLSRTKVSYIKNIAQAVINGELDLNNIEEMNDEEIINSLVKIKGVGVWTAEMFLIFSLNRKDVLSYKDLGLRKGIKWLYGMENEPTKEEFQYYKDRFSPYNTLAAFYLWEITIKNLFAYKDIVEAKKAYERGCLLEEAEI